MSQVYSLQARRTIGALQIAIIILVAITASVHLSRGISMSTGGPPPGAVRRPAGAAAGGAAGRTPGGAPSGFNIMRVLPLPLPTLFLLNGIGYIVLLIAFFLPALAPYHNIVRWLLIAFAAVTILMYLAIVGVRTNPTGWTDKVAEIALIILLLLEGRQPARARGGAIAT